jgi:hypothetical protein
MIPYQKDSAIIMIRTTENGYTIELAQWDINPPPKDLLYGNTDPAATLKRMYNADDKAELKTLFASWLDNLFDQ